MYYDIMWRQEDVRKTSSFSFGLIEKKPPEICPRMRHFFAWKVWRCGDDLVSLQCAYWTCQLHSRWDEWFASQLSAFLFISLISGAFQTVFVDF